MHTIWEAISAFLAVFFLEIFSAFLLTFIMIIFVLIMWKITDYFLRFIAYLYKRGVYISHKVK